MPSSRSKFAPFANDPRSAYSGSTPATHHFDLNDGWCHTHRTYCSMATAPKAPASDGTAAGEHDVEYGAQL